MHRMNYTAALRRGALIMSMALVFSLLVGCGESKKSYDYQFSEPKAGDEVAVIHTTMGDITVRFFPQEAPKAVENFVTHAKEGYYDGAEFFRVLSDFMIQSGDPTGSGRGGESIYGEPFEDEFVEYLSPFYGALCMANTGRNTNTSQFFIVTSTSKDISRAEEANESAARAEQVSQEKLAKYAEVGGAIWLDYQVGTLYANRYAYTPTAHTVFGQVLSGMEVAEEISRVSTYTKVQEDDAMIDDSSQTKVLENKPKEPVLITSIEILTYPLQ